MVASRAWRIFRLGSRRLAVTAHALRFALAEEPRPLRPRLPPDLPPDGRVLFLCHGNICRSPLAERYARRRLRALDGGEYTVDSAGFVEREGRLSPDPAIEVAREVGVELSTHRSRCVTDDQLDESDVVVLMDVGNYYDLWRRRPGITDRSRFLKVFGDGGPEDYRIDDPDGSGTETFRRVYDEITRAVDGLVEALPRGDGDDPGRDAVTRS